MSGEHFWVIMFYVIVTDVMKRICEFISGAYICFKVKDSMIFLSNVISVTLD
jgi:hypothetical protein